MTHNCAAAQLSNDAVVLRKAFERMKIERDKWKDRADGLSKNQRRVKTEEALKIAIRGLKYFISWRASTEALRRIEELRKK